MPHWVWPVGWVALVVVVIVALAWSGRTRDEGDSAAARALAETAEADCPMCPPMMPLDMVEVGVFWVHRDCLAAHVKGWAPTDCCRDALWGTDEGGDSHPFWPQSEWWWPADPPTDDELRRIVDKLREPE